MAKPAATWAQVPSDTLVSGHEKTPLVVLENAKARATNPTAIGSQIQALPLLTGPEKSALGHAWQ